MVFMGFLEFNYIYLLKQCACTAHGRCRQNLVSTIDGIFAKPLAVIPFSFCFSCLSEYILVEFGGRNWKLCHSNVTTPVLIGHLENSGYFDSSGHVTILVKWVGVLDIRTSYLGRYVVV